MSYCYKDKKVFISGPMTGQPDWNRAEFDRAERELRELEARDVLNPTIFSPMPGETPLPHEAYMAKTLNVLTWLDHTSIPSRPYYDCIVMLDGWWASDGARVERAVAEAMGLDVIEWDEPEYL